MASDQIKAPSLLLQMMELRAPYELAGTMMLWPLLRAAPRGDGHAVLVLPGLLAHDRSTALLRRFLKQRGYAPHGWEQGNNLGPRAGVLEGLIGRLDALHASSGGRVSVVGWSLGGIYARMLANERPEAVRNVIMLGSPIGGQPRASNAWRLYERVSGRRADDVSDWVRAEHNESVPSTSIYTETDGVVAWRNSLQASGEMAENIRVHASHLGLGVNAAVLYAVADRLAQPEGGWQPFEPPSLLRHAYPQAN
ncbi:esterase/lipase family protein [Halopseudomonas maritima]|uniref:esterase/lipase family protein n=1 Tax=Halopseudomonas maritima TaxID=2918528 RepID=UPI001EEBFB66|nr:alpha/beta fold hydrolase [Halopseudomonas maritima]UJJ33078.1 GPI inositol-deacylase [Halopseudomonas maritima]